MKRSSKRALLDITLADRRERFQTAYKALEELGGEGDWRALAKLDFFDYIRDLWSADRKLRFLCCSLQNLQLSFYRQQQHTKPKCKDKSYRNRCGVSFCQMRWCCDFCYRAHLYGLRPSLKQNEQGEEKDTKRLGQIARWKNSIINLLREHTVTLGPAYFLSWSLSNPKLPISPFHIEQLDRSIKQIRERDRRRGNPAAWILPTRVDGFKNQVRAVYLGMDNLERVPDCISIHPRSLEIQSGTRPVFNDLQTPLEMIERDDFGPWKVSIRPSFYWFDESKRPAKMTRPEFFRANLDKAIEWLVGESTPWTTDTKTCLRLDREFHRVKLFRLPAGLFNWKNDRPSMRMLAPDGETTLPFDSNKFFGEDGLKKGCTHLLGPNEVCPECGAKEKVVIGI